MGCASSKPPQSAASVLPLPNEPELPAPKQPLVEASDEAVAIVNKFTVNMWLAHSTQAMRVIMSQAEARSYFADFLRAEFAEHNLDFFVAMQRYRALSASGIPPEQLAVTARTIFDRYLALNSSDEVNVSSGVRAAVEAGATAEDTGALMRALDEAQEEVLRMMSLDCFPRFLRSSYMEHLQAAMFNHSSRHAESLHASDSSPDFSPAPSARLEAAQDMLKTAEVMKSGPLDTFSGSAEEKGLTRRDSFSKLARYLRAAQDDLLAARIPTSDSIGGEVRKHAVKTANVHVQGSAENVAASVETDASHPALGLRSRWIEAFIAISDLMPTCIVISDMLAADYPMIYVNKAFCDVTGYRREEAIGRNCRFIQGPGTDQEQVALIRRSLRTGNELHGELLNFKRDGRPFRNFLSLRPVWQELSDKQWDNLVADQAAGAGGSMITGTQDTDGCISFDYQIHAPSVNGVELSPTSIRKVSGPILMTILPSEGAPVRSGSYRSMVTAGPMRAAPQGVSSAYRDRVSAMLLGKKARLAYFIGVQFEIENESLVPQRLVQHNALLQMLPLTVGF